jgi:ferrous iron transport protein B
MSPRTAISAARPVVLVGQANVGKSVLFGLLTGEYAWVSNYPGTTVEIMRGRQRLSRREIIDTPGINSLAAESEDERVALEILASEESAVLVQVADARNLTRALSLTLQLADLGRPMVLAVNFMDEAEAAGLRLDLDRLGSLLGIEAVPMVAIEGRGLGQLRRAIERARMPANGTAPPPAVAAEPRLAMAAAVSGGQPGCHAAACAVAAVCGPSSWTAHAPDSGAPGSATWHRRRRWLAGQLPLIIRQTGDRRLQRSEQIDEWLRCFPVGLAVMVAVGALVYVAVGLGAGLVSDFLTERVFAQRLTPWLAGALARTGVRALAEFMTGRYGLFSTGLSYALGLVLPVIATYFFLFAALEDSGYLPRLAVLWHRAAERVGLSGKAIVPLALGLGCGTMATVATRVLPTRRERILAALLIALGIPCSAQLGVLMGLVAGLSIWAPLVIAGVVFLQLLWVGKLGARLMPGASPDFVLELPPLRLPRFGNLLRKTALRVIWYLKEAVPLFLAGSTVLFLLDRLNLIDGVVALGRPVVTRWLGLPPEAALAFVMGFLRRDFGAAGLYALARSGQMDVTQIVVASVTLVLFIPCLANFLMLVKEFGTRAALRVAAVTIVVALLAGGLLHALLAVF